MRIDNLRRNDRGGKILAYFTLIIEDKEGQDLIKINDCKLISGGNGGMFVGTPSRKYTARDGQEKWTYIVDIVDGVMKDKVTKLAMQEYGVETEEFTEDDLPF